MTDVDDWHDPCYDDREPDMGELRGSAGRARLRGPLQPGTRGQGSHCPPVAADDPGFMTEAPF